MLADIVDVPVERPAMVETTALGAARLAGLHLGLLAGLDDVANGWTLDRRCEAEMPEATRQKMIEGWQRAITRVKLDGH